MQVILSVNNVFLFFLCKLLFGDIGFKTSVNFFFESDTIYKTHYLGHGYKWLDCTNSGEWKLLFFNGSIYYTFLFEINVILCFVSSHEQNL